MSAQVLRDSSGTAALEFGLTAPFFFVLLIGVVQFGLVLWTQAALQHGAEMAARCATVNTTVCSDTNAIKTFASKQSFGLNPPLSTFTVTTPACGNRVQASYVFNFITVLFGSPTITITAASCFPK